ncbi:MAG: DUF2220 domain-containing protein [Rhodospirillales bacterium]|nr:DUF2220 domain-containing protein [Rhodospirillales bacterium]
MQTQAKSILENLIRRAEVNPERVRQAMQKIVETEIDPLDLEGFHQDLRAAEKAGAVTLDWGKRESSHILQRVRLADLDKACRFIGAERSDTLARRAADGLRRDIPSEWTWAQDIIDEMERAWRRRKSAYGIDAARAEDVSIAIRTVHAIEERSHEGLDMRTFSRRLFSDSKAVEGVTGPVAAMCRKKFGLDDLGQDQVLEAIGLLKFPQPVLVAGRLRLKNGGYSLTDITPYIGLPPSGHIPIEPDGRPGYVMTIENLASFNRYVREISDDGLVIYTGGYPSRATGGFIQDIAAHIDQNIPWFHWGDIDADGLLILEKVAGLSGRTVIPHLMSPAIAREKGIQCAAAGKVARLADCDLPCSELAGFLSNQGAHILEQEELDPIPPKLNT